jgi:serine/threonine-protein kinase
MVGKLVIGDVLGGKYRIDALIGEGGMGVVARATQLDLGRLVAVKALRPEVQGNEQVIERFYREARAASRITGPHSLQILDVGRTESGAPYMVMELLEGEDLDHLIRRKGKLRLDMAVWLMVQACSGVADAHRMRVVHRDLKPSNLFLARRAGGPVLKVLDFGISRLDDQASQLTRTMTQLGTPHYMSPEQIERPKSVDHRTDIWALGCIFQRLVTGHTAFRGQGMQLVSAVIRGNRKRPSELVPDLPKEVDQIIDRCLAPNPADRYQSAEELTVALRPLQAGDLSDSEPVTTPVPSDESEESTTVDVAVEVEQTLALENSRGSFSGARPSHLSHTRVMDVPSSRAPVSRAQWSIPAVTRIRPGGTWAPALLVLLLAVIAGVVFLVAPSVLAKRAAASASEAGFTLRYTEPRVGLSGLEVRDVEVSMLRLPSVKVHAARARLSYSADQITLIDADADLAASKDELVRVLTPLAKGSTFSVRAENLHFVYGGGDLRVEGTHATLTVEHLRAALTCPDVRATAFGVELPPVTGHFEGSPEEGAFSGSPQAEGQGIQVSGSYDAAGGSISLRAPRQQVSPSLLSLSGFGSATNSSAGRTEMALSLDARTAAGTTSGALYLSVFGVQTTDRAMDLEAHVSFHGKELGQSRSLTVDGGKVRLGPFALTPSGSARLGADDATSVSVVTSSGVVPCAELARASTSKLTSLYGVNVPELFALPGTPATTGNAEVVLAMDVKTSGTSPTLSLGLRQAATCGLRAFDRSRAP